jgi:hypothetical protein
VFDEVVVLVIIIVVVHTIMIAMAPALVDPVVARWAQQLITVS